MADLNRCLQIRAPAILLPLYDGCCTRQEFPARGVYRCIDATVHLNRVSIVPVFDLTPLFLFPTAESYQKHQVLLSKLSRLCQSSGGPGEDSRWSDPCFFLPCPLKVDILPPVISARSISPFRYIQLTRSSRWAVCATSHLAQVFVHQIRMLYFVVLRAWG